MNKLTMPLESPLRKKTCVFVVISDNLSHGTNRFVRSVQSLSRCLVSSGVTQGVLIKDVPVRRTIYLTLLRSHLGYATQVWAPQSIELVCKVERIQRRASKYILNLPFHCQQSHKDRLIQLTCFP